MNEAVLRTGRMMDTSPPIWELQSARERQNVYERELILAQYFASRGRSCATLAFTFANGKASLAALGVNMLTTNAFTKNCNTAIGRPFAEKHE